jgi:DNA-binding GntR family transcriptional regulator
VLRDTIRMSRQPAEEPLAPTASKADLVYERLSASILNGTMKPLARLNADEIARRLGVSKIPVREALQRLEIQGLVTQTQHTGASVAPLSEREIAGIRYARLALDPLVARLAAEHASDAAVARVRAIQERMRLLAARRALPELDQLNRDFHAEIARATGYDVLVDLVETTLLRVRRYRAVMPISAERWNVLLVEHDTIVEAIADRSPDGAAKAALAHASGPFTLGGAEFKPVPKWLG